MRQLGLFKMVKAANVIQLHYGASIGYRKTWMQCVEEDMKLVKLCGDDAQDCVNWRIGIRGK